MAKNSSNTTRNVNMGGDYDQMQANIRKAKGNPNKNVHHKKNGSNYKGYAAAQREAQASAAARKHEKSKLPTWVVVTMAVIFVILVAILILMNTAMQDNLIFGQIATIIIGACCGILFSMRRYTKNPDSKLQDVIYIVLAVMAVVLIFMGGYGLLQVLRV